VTGAESIVEHCLHLSIARSVEDCEMYKLVAASCLVAAACGQFVEPKNAKILKEQRFNAGDGRFGSAFAQEDGTVYREETSADGERVGQYSYIDNDGKTITVRYTAGKDGFRILEGAHVPTGATGQESAAFVAKAPAPVAAPVQVAAPVRQAAPVAQPIDYDYADEPVDPNFNPFINPHDPTHRDFQFNRNGANFGPNNENTFVNSVPACADCAGVNPFINPFDASHQAGVQQFRATAPARPTPVQQPRFQQPAQPVQQAFSFETTPSPRNFFPPGQLKLNRFESGFNFDFSSQ
jgi:hypothetical protein